MAFGHQSLCCHGSKTGKPVHNTPVSAKAVPRWTAGSHRRDTEDRGRRGEGEADGRGRLSQHSSVITGTTFSHCVAGLVLECLPKLED